MVERLRNNNGDVLNYIAYSDADEVLQHKKHGVEMAHITLHPDRAHIRTKRSKAHADALIAFVKSDLSGFMPSPSQALRNFIRIVKPQL